MANTYNQSSSGFSILLAKFNYNDSLRALLENFNGSNPPGFGNIIIDGQIIYPVPDGVLHKNSLTGSLYITDTLNNKGNPVLGSNWTVNGIGPRVFDSLGQINIATLEVGEVVATVGNNSRLYVKSSNSNANSLVDVGLPIPGSITSSKIANNTVTANKIENGIVSFTKLVPNSITNVKIQANTIIKEKLANSLGGSNLYLGFDSNGAPTTVTGSFGGIFTKSFDSGNVSIAGKSYINVTHGFGTIPKIVYINYICIIDELGYIAGDIVSSHFFKYADGQGGYSCKLDTANISLSWNDPYLPGYIYRVTTGAAAFAHDDNWNVRITAYA